MRDFLNKIGSIRWTIAILLLLAGVGAVGTFIPRGQAAEVTEKMASPVAAKIIQAFSFVGVFQSVWLRVLLISLVFNLLACIITRIPAVVSAARGETAVRREPVLVLDDTVDNFTRVTGSLRSLGFRKKRGTVENLYSRGTTGYVMTLLAHGSIVIIMASSLTGSLLGFVATQRIHIGLSSVSAYNWKTEKDMKLPFEVKPVELLFQPNPVSVRLGIQDLESDAGGKVINSYEGGTFQVPGLPGSVTLEHFNIETKQFRAVWVAPDGTRVRFGSGSAIGGSNLALIPVAYARWPERQVQVNTELRLDGRIIQSGAISINHPMSHDGVTLYLTDYGKDEFGFSYAGFQFVRDPGKTGVWIGCVIFVLSITGALFIRHSCAVIREEEGALSVYISSRGDREGIAQRLRFVFENSANSKEAAP